MHSSSRHIIFGFLLGISGFFIGKLVIDTWVIFYPAQLAVPEQGAEQSVTYQYSGPWNRKLFDGLYDRAPAIAIAQPVKGGIVPHHLLAGDFAAGFFETIRDQVPGTIVLIGPNHFGRGGAPIISSLRDWKTPYGIVQSDTDFVSAHASLIAVNESVIAEEHSIYSIVPFIARSVPDSKILPIIIRQDTPTATLDRLVELFATQLPEDTVFVGSIDFSHYQHATGAEFHDAFSINAIETFDYDRAMRAEIDSPESLYTILKLMERFGTQHIAHAMHTNAAEIVRDPSQTNLTSYYTPFFVGGEPASDTTPTILHFGDIMLDRNVAAEMKEYGEDHILTTLAGTEERFFHGSDIVGANLEGPFANERIFTTKEIAFRFDPVLLPMFKRYGFTTFSQANNHSYDMGRQGFSDSLKNLRDAGFFAYGEQYQVDDDALLVQNIGNKTVAFIGVNDTNAPIDLEKTKALVASAAERHDYVIINIHWGVEYQPVSHPRQQFLAHAFIDSGADVVIGHHPHVVQEVEVYKEKPIFYSLGNFIFDQYFSKPTQEGLGIGLVLAEQGMSTYFFPLQSKRSVVSQMPYDQANQFMAELIDRSRLDSYTINNFSLHIQ